MLWEEGGSSSWRALGVTGQPAWMLLDQHGQVLINRQSGGINENQVLQAIS